ncbi:MAG: DUF1330 domain-containing protein [Rhodocyclales bacterium GT-UBC]|nr:MAG: DUF1330 domain-containing protein [Rhodocyclales bacterium GT-UBC]
MARYRLLSQAAVEHYGGRFLVRGGVMGHLEGGRSLPERLVVVEFDSVDQARRFYDSPEYQVARKVREQAAEMNMLLVAGVENLI